MNAQDLRLDYFLLYEVARQSVRESVALKGQFDKEPERGKLLFLDRFANPISKNGEDFYDENAHLTCYYLYESMPEPTRVVVLENQFGEQKFLIGNGFGLLAPAMKTLERESVFPEKLDHYKVYEVLEGEPLNAVVPFRDQFRSAEVRVTYPHGFAVPVEKEHEGKAFPIQNERAHLTLYKVGVSRMSRVIQVRDQFGRYILRVERSALLAVPGLKHEWQEA